MIGSARNNRYYEFVTRDTQTRCTRWLHGSTAEKDIIFRYKFAIDRVPSRIVLERVSFSSMSDTHAALSFHSMA